MAPTRAKKTGKRPAGKSTEKPPFRAAVEAVAGEGPAPTEITLRNGIVLNLKPVPPLIIRKATGRLTRPKAPLVDLGKGRKEENVSDPDFLKAQEQFGQDAFDAGANVMLALGTSVKSVPDDLDKPQDDGWVEQLTTVGFEVDISSDTARYLSWIQYYALSNEEDLLKVVLGVTKLTGVGESEVAAAVSSFRGGAARGSDNGVPAKDTP